MDERIKLGAKVRENISGFEGVVVSRVEYLSGAADYCEVRPKCDGSGKRLTGEWFHAAELTVIP